MLPFAAELPPLEQERIACSISAAVKYEVPANIVLAVAEKEGGKPGQWVRNTNGTHDVGPMQFNTAYLRELERYGIMASDVAAAGCYSFDLAAWRLRMHLRNDKGDIWTRAANYHSRTPQFNGVYRADLMNKAAKWADWLEARFSTLDVTKVGAKPSTPIMKLAVAPGQAR
jgi:transglycosylase-like protein with SLT domain